VLDYAKAMKLRSGENPAAWRGNLKHVLPAPKKLSRGHHAAMPYAEVPAFVAKLRERPAMVAMALELLILTVARSGEVLGACWAEIDMAAEIWTVPASRMKSGHEHRVPLSNPAAAILETLVPVRSGTPLVFDRRGRALSGMSMAMLLRRMGEPFTVHGFRSSFRDWAGNETSFPRELCEAALAHSVGNAVEAAYRRSDALEKRRALMTAWASFLDGASGQRRPDASHDGR
jgi:integrase